MAYSIISQKATYSSSLQPTRNPSEPRKILLTSPSGRGSWEAGGKDDSVDGSVVKGTSEISAHGCRCRSSTAADRKSTRLNSSHRCISYAVFCLKKKKTIKQQ